jgi:hypothetical protein
MRHRFAIVAAAAAAVAGGAACSPDTTSFRPIERADSGHAGPPSVVYDIQFNEQRASRAHVWSSGGYLSSTGQPMTHIGVEIRNATARPLAFDADALELVVFDRDGARLPPARLAMITPRSPSLIIVPPVSTAMVGAYFELPVRPRTVGSMQVRWLLRLDADEYRQVTGFLRDDDTQVVAPTSPPEPRSPSS